MVRSPSESKNLERMSKENPVFICKAASEDIVSSCSVEAAEEATEDLDTDGIILFEKCQSEYPIPRTEGEMKMMQHSPSLRDKRKKVFTWLKAGGKKEGTIKAMSTEACPKEVPAKPPATRLRSAPLDGEKDTLGSSPNTLYPLSGFSRMNSHLSEASSTSELDPADLVPCRPREDSDSTADPTSPAPVAPPRRHKRIVLEKTFPFPVDVKRSQSERVPKLKEEKSLIKGLARRISNRHMSLSPRQKKQNIQRYHPPISRNKGKL